MLKLALIISDKNLDHTRCENLIKADAKSTTRYKKLDRIRYKHLIMQMILDTKKLNTEEAKVTTKYKKNLIISDANT